MYGDGEDFFTLKGVIESIFAAFDVVPTYSVSAEPYLHPGRQAAATVDGQTLAVFGEVHPQVADKYDLDTRVYVAEVQISRLFAIEQKPIHYKALPRFPAVERDLALLCDASLPVAEIEDSIRKAGGKLLETVKLFDVYQGSQIEAGKKSVAFSLMFRSGEGTLSDEQIASPLKKIFAALAEKGCNLRS